MPPPRMATSNWGGAGRFMGNDNDVEKEGYLDCRCVISRWTCSSLYRFRPTPAGREGPLVWCFFRLSSETVKKPGWRGQCPHLLSLSRDRLPKNPPTHTAKRR